MELKNDTVYIVICLNLNNNSEFIDSVYADEDLAEEQISFLNETNEHPQEIKYIIESFVVKYAINKI